MPFIISAAIIMFVGVGLGAFGAHGLRELLESAGHTRDWETAVFYHLIHAVALFALGIWQANDPSARGSGLLRAVGILWCAGILLFSGSLYLLSIGGPNWLGPVTPLGGLGFLTGWGVLALGARKLGNVARG